MQKLVLCTAMAVTTLATQGCSRAHAYSAATPPPMTRQQALARADSLFRTFDVTDDGIVTRGEAIEVGRRMLAIRAATHKDAAPGIGGHTLKYLEKRFAGAQSATRPQFETAMLAHFDQMDVNHDGVLTAAERARAPVP